MKFHGTDGGNSDLGRYLNLSNQLAPTYYKSANKLYRIPGTNWGALERYSAEDGGWVDMRPFAHLIRESAVRLVEKDAVAMAEKLYADHTEKVSSLLGAASSKDALSGDDLW